MQTPRGKLKKFNPLCILLLLAPVAIHASPASGKTKIDHSRILTAKFSNAKNVASEPSDRQEVLGGERKSEVERADEYMKAGDYSKASKIWEKIAIEAYLTLGKEHHLTAKSMNNLAFIYEMQGLFANAERLYLMALEIKTKVFGENNPGTATSLDNLASLYMRQGLYEKAEPLFHKALKIRENTLGAEHPDTRISLHNTGSLYMKQGLYSKAEYYLLRSLAISEKGLGPKHPEVASSLDSLAILYMKQGLYSKADALFSRALSIRKMSLGMDNPDTALSLNNLASLYMKQADYEKAEPLLALSLTIKEKTLGAKHPETAISLSNIARVNEYKGNYHKAALLYETAHSIFLKAVGSSHDDTAVSLQNLGRIYKKLGLNGKAETHYNQALEIARKKFGVDHPDVAIALNNVGLLHRAIGMRSKSENELKKAMEILEKTLGSNHPLTHLSQINLAGLYGDIGRSEHQIAMLTSAINAQNKWLAREAPILSRQKRANLLETLTYAWLIPFDLASYYQTAAVLGLSTRLNRQGILQEIEQLQSLILRAPSPKQELASQLGSLNTQLASVNINSSQRQEIRTQRDLLEAQLYRLMPDLQLKEVNPAQVSAALPADSVLIEFQRYQPYNDKKPKDQPWGAPQYLALILKPNGSIKAVPLGPAKPIEAAIAKALASTQEALADSKTNLDSVRHLVLDPLKSQLKDSNHWFLSPDAELTRIPFLALPAAGPGQRLLSDDVKISVLTTGRDLLRLQKPPGASEKAAVIVNPSFTLNAGSNSLASADLSDQVGQRRSAQLGSKTWQPLPQTQQEGEDISKLLGVAVVSKDQATTNLLQTIHGPKVLHVATHGFFQPNQETTPPDLLRTIGSDHQLLSSLKSEDPMLRSGLVLAGADTPTANPADDGYLTAAEATGLQLDGTELVVLSACSTGQGDSKTGEGVYGLQRALTVAGARSTLLSLWKVDDDATRAFMVRYYTLLKEGKGRGDALVQVQREFRTDPAYKAKNWDRPYYWAAWQLTGDWKPIKGLSSR